MTKPDAIPELDAMTLRGFRLLFVYEPESHTWQGSFRKADGSYSCAIAHDFETCVKDLHTWSTSATPWRDLKPKPRQELSLDDLLS